MSALGVGGTVWASTASADDLGGSERDRVVAAAKDAAGPGEVVSAESSDRDRDDRDADDRNEAYEVEIRKADGTEVDVKLDKDMKVIAQDTDGRDDRDDSDDARDDVNDPDDANEAPDADDRVLSATERSSAGKAATEAVGGGTVTDLDASDDRASPTRSTCARPTAPTGTSTSTRPSPWCTSRSTADPGTPTVPGVLAPTLSRWSGRRGLPVSWNGDRGTIGP